MDDRDHSVEVYRSWADQAWGEQLSSDSGQCIQGAYEAGFKDGFVDYVYGGGSGEPPPVPPRPFWNVDLRNPNGHTEATDWFAGYRHGAQVAKEEGYRKRALIPSSMFLLGTQGVQPYDQPNYGEPSPAPFSEAYSGIPPAPFTDSLQPEYPLQPEYVAPGQVQPETQGTVEPKQLPKLDKPSDAIPKGDNPKLDTPADGKLPRPTADFEEDFSPQDSELPELPGAFESPAEDSLPEDRPSEEFQPLVDPPTDVDDIFGSRARSQKRQRVRRQQGVRRMNFEKTIRQEGVIRQKETVQQARSAFASAIRKRSQPGGNKPNSKGRATTPRSSRAVTTPKSKDRADEVFRRSSL